MRHFSHTCNNPIVSYNISAGEYEADVDVAYSDTLKALAVAMEVPYTKLCYNLVQLLREGNDRQEYYPMDLAPAEWRVVLELQDFFTAVRSGDYWNTRSTVFSYVNCNTGKSAVWVHVIA